MVESHQHHKTVVVKIPDKLGRERLDKYIGRRPDLKITRTRLQKLIEAGLVLINGKPAGHNHVLKGGEEVTVKIPPPPRTDVEPEDLPLDIIYEDDHLLVVNKPAGMVTHPGAGNYTGTLVNALLYYSPKLSGVQGIDRPGIVHRLDKNTSGLILIAKNDMMHVSLQTELEQRKIIKTYQALVCGHMKKDSDLIELPIGRSLKNRKKMAVTGLKGRAARTGYKLLDRFKLYDLLEVNLKTGRTHQIRVHFSHLGHPVFGDPDYGGRIKWHKGIFTPDRLMAQKALEMMPRQALHARSLEFVHPVTGEMIALTSDLPADFRDLLDFLSEEGR